MTARPSSDAARAAADIWVATATEDPELQDSGLGEYVTGAEDLDGLPLTEARPADGEGDDEEQADAGGGFASACSTPRSRDGCWFRALGWRRGRESDWPGDRCPKHDGGARGPFPRGDRRHRGRPSCTWLGCPPRSCPADLQAMLCFNVFFWCRPRCCAKLSAGKAKSPLEAALVSGGAKDDGNLSAKGSAARDAFVRILKDSQLAADQIRRLAAEELGEDAVNPLRAS